MSTFIPVSKPAPSNHYRKDDDTSWLPITVDTLLYWLTTPINRAVLISDSGARIHRGIVAGIVREDGSGSSFNVTIDAPYTGKTPRGPSRETFHVRLSR
jgi:hypothetical protein